jgi:hypothetical protein
MTSPGAAPRPSSHDPHVLDPAHAPTPFTADEIRRGCPVGRTIAVRIEQQGEAPIVRITRYVACDESAATIERRRVTAEGEPPDPGRTERATWRELQAHASFPSLGTTIAPEVIDTPLGRLACLRYSVEDGATRRTFWFAPEVPGMPVKMEVRQQGRVALTVTMIRDSLRDGIVSR